MRISVNKGDAIDDLLMFLVSVLFILTGVFMAMTKQYATVELRNDIYFIAEKTTWLLVSISFCRRAKGLLNFFIVPFVTYCSVRIANELLYVFSICDTNSYLLIFIETIIVLLSLLIYKKFDKIKSLWSK